MGKGKATVNESAISLEAIQSSKLLLHAPVAVTIGQNKPTELPKAIGATRTPTSYI